MCKHVFEMSIIANAQIIMKVHCINRLGLDQLLTNVGWCRFSIGYTIRLSISYLAGASLEDIDVTNVLRCKCLDYKILVSKMSTGLVQGEQTFICGYFSRSGWR